MRPKVCLPTCKRKQLKSLVNRFSSAIEYVASGLNGAVCQPRVRGGVTSLDPGTGFTVRAAWFPT